MIMITFTISTVRGPMFLMVSGLLGESDFGNGSHFSRCAQHQYSQGLPNYQETVMLSNVSTSRGMVDQVWVRM